MYFQRHIHKSLSAIYLIYYYTAIAVFSRSKKMIGHFSEALAKIIFLLMVWEIKILGYGKEWITNLKIEVYLYGGSADNIVISYT